MMTITKGKDVGIQVATGLAVLTLIATLGVMLLVKPPTTAGIAPAQRRAENQLLDETEAARKDVAKREAALAKPVWSVPAQEVGPVVVGTATRLAATSAVKLSGIRPQRTTIEGKVETMPFVISAEGSFPNVLRFVSGLETPENRLAVSLIQMTSADGATDRVTATIGVTAFRLASGAKSG